MASQLFVDLYGCDKRTLNDLDIIRKIAHTVISDIPSRIVEECYHKFQPIGITYIAVITTSHFSIHTWPEHGYAAVDIFSCEQNLPTQIADRLAALFGAKEQKTRQFDREISAAERM